MAFSPELEHQGRQATASSPIDVPGHAASPAAGLDLSVAQHRSSARAPPCSPVSRRQAQAPGPPHRSRPRVTMHHLAIEFSGLNRSGAAVSAGRRPRVAARCRRSPAQRWRRVVHAPGVRGADDQQHTRRFDTLDRSSPGAGMTGTAYHGLSHHTAAPAADHRGGRDVNPRRAGTVPGAERLTMHAPGRPAGGSHPARSEPRVSARWSAPPRHPALHGQHCPAPTNPSTQQRRGKERGRVMRRKAT